MYWRGLRDSVTEALRDTPVVMVTGARQTGKTTLVRDMGSYRTMDEAATLAAATSDPNTFLDDVSKGADEPVVLDEVQFVPGLFPAIKLSVDRDRRPGRFLLTGSANVLLLPKLSESLAGRMAPLRLRPLAQAEIEGAKSNFVDDLFAVEFPVRRRASMPTPDRREVVRRIVAGGYPEALARPEPERQRAWFEACLTTILQRDVREIASIEGLTKLPRLLAILASRASGIFSFSDVARDSGIPYATLHRYMALLEATYLVELLPVWSRSLGRRMTKAPKLIIGDTGFATGLLRLDDRAVLANDRLLGQLVENFVALELQKLSGWSLVRPVLYHWRTTSREEVDFVLEGTGGSVVGIEVKSSSTVTAADFKHLRLLETECGEQFLRGVVLYVGEHAVSFSPTLRAVPISALWS